MATHDHEILVPHPYSAETRASLESELAGLEDATLTIAETPDETLAGFETATVAITPRLSDEWLERADALEWMQASSAGVDHYDLDALSERGIVLTNATGVHAQPIAEQVLGAMLSFEREFLRARDQQREGIWLRTEGGELASKTVGIVGLGAIGGRVAELASAVGSRVIGTKRDPSSAPDAAETVYPPDELDEVLRRSDYLVLACPLTEETRGLIDGAALETMPEEAVLVNIARGEVTDQEALVEGLQQGRISGAALDVFEEEPLPEGSPLWDLPNVLLTPHMAGSTPHYFERIGEIFRENFECFVDGDLEEMRNRIV
ncbi:D-2-hydroxyacid dehydrogenase [Halomontanus rarus]|uniref:D-2-hydroxyacid dehydrogenase n=1 Tax=Halomontanus rarus TaxID=3034020 RepID=UPI0023E804EB|nr:D-2-hydroxyacid dehydrogenase [Halovivax sp. TS33]